MTLIDDGVQDAESDSVHEAKPDDVSSLSANKEASSISADSQVDKPGETINAGAGVSTIAGSEISAKGEESQLLNSQVDAGMEGNETQTTELDDPSTQNANDTFDKPQDAEHLPEPPASPTSNTAFSGTTSTPSNTDLPPKPAATTSKAPSANRISIFYAGGSRRLIIDAEIVNKLVLLRSEGRVELEINVERAEDGFKGILVIPNEVPYTRMQLTCCFCNRLKYQMRAARATPPCVS